MLSAGVIKGERSRGDYMITSRLAALVEGMCSPVFAPGRQSFISVFSSFFHRFCSVWAALGDLASFLMRFCGHFDKSRETEKSALASYDIEILIALSYRKRCVRPQEFVAEDLGQEDVVGLVFWFEEMGADGAVCASPVARFPGSVQRAESVGDVLG